MKFPFKIESPFNARISDFDIRRKLISDSIFPQLKYPVLINQHLEQLFSWYDYYFFNNMISYALKKSNGKIIFELSNRLTKTGGTYTRDGLFTYLIKISSYKLNQLTPQNISNVTAQGLHPKDRVEALQLIFEHELIHVIISIFTNEIESHGQLFKDLAFNLFGHTKITHGITDTALSQLNPDQKQMKNKDDFHLNQIVYFIYKDQKLAGKIIKLNRKRAKINTEKGVFNVSYDGILIN